MQDSRKLSVQRQGKKRFLPSGQIRPLLPCRHQRHQDFPRIGRAAHEQMAQIALMGKAMVKGRFSLFKIRKGRRQYPAVILIHNAAAVHRHDVVKAALFVHSKRQRAVLYLVPEGKFHLVPVSVADRACLDRLDPAFRLLLCKHRLQQPVHLPLLDLKRLFIGHGHIAAAAAASKITAAAVVCVHRFLRRFFQNLLQPPFPFSLAYFCYRK